MADDLTEAAERLRRMEEIRRDHPECDDPACPLCEEYAELLKAMHEDMMRRMP